MGLPCVVNPVAWANIDAHFPDTVAARLVVPKVTRRNPVDPPLNRHPGPQVLQAVKPSLIRVASRARQVMADLHRLHLRSKAKVAQQRNHASGLLVVLWA
jgi:hypothetical protein